MDLKQLRSERTSPGGLWGVKIDDTLLLIVHNLSIMKHKMVFNGILACLFTIFTVFLSRECDLRLTWCEDELRHSLIVCLISGTPRSLKEALHPDRFASLISMIIVRRMAANSRQHLLDAIHINFYVDITRCLLKSGGDGKVFGFCLFVCSNVNTTTTRTNERNVLHQLRHEGKFFFVHSSFRFSFACGAEGNCVNYASHSFIFC